jgi:hypothetical protein
MKWKKIILSGRRAIGYVFVLVLAFAALASGCIYLNDTKGMVSLGTSNESNSMNISQSVNASQGTNTSQAISIANISQTAGAPATGTYANAALGGSYAAGDYVEYLGVKGKISSGSIVDGNVPDYLQINDDKGALLVYASSNTSYGHAAVVHYPMRGAGEGEADVYVKGELIATMKWYGRDSSFNAYVIMACEPDKYPDFAKNITIRILRDCP